MISIGERRNAVSLNSLKLMKAQYINSKVQILLQYHVLKKWYKQISTKQQSKNLLYNVQELILLSKKIFLT